MTKKIQNGRRQKNQNAKPSWKMTKISSNGRRQKNKMEDNQKRFK